MLEFCPQDPKCDFKKKLADCPYYISYWSELRTSLGTLETADLA